MKITLVHLWLVLLIIFSKHVLCDAQTTNSVPASINKFAVELYGKLLEESKDNLFFSPYSISTALTMTYAGAKNNTAKEMEKVLNIEDMENVHTKYKMLLNRLQTSGNDEVLLKIANSLWVQKDYTFLNEFLDVTEESYGAPVNLVQFQGNEEREKTRKKINDWVEEKTNNKIKDLLHSDDLDDLTRLVLTNAIYFNAKWAMQFDPKQTQEGKFHITSDQTLDASFMKQMGEYNYYENDELQYLEIPYSSGSLSMGIILPREIEGLYDYEMKMRYEQITEILTSASKQKVNLLIPKFDLSNRFNLIQMLIKMGMVEPFSGHADFSGMTGKKDLLISKVIHQAYVDVNEEGTEAAAATAVVVSRKAAVDINEKTFKADHPFIFIIKDNETNCILFMGRVCNPKTTK